MLGGSATGGLGIGVVCYNSGLRAEAVRLSRFGATVLFTGKEEVEASVVNLGVSLFNIVFKRGTFLLGRTVWSNNHKCLDLKPRHGLLHIYAH